MPKWYTAWFSSPIPGTACCALSPLGKLLHLTGPRSSTTGPCRDCCSTTACEKSGDILPLTVVNTRPYPQQPPEPFQSGVSFVQEFTYQVVTGKMCQENSTYLCQDEEDMAETGIKETLFQGADSCVALHEPPTRHCEVTGPSHPIPGGREYSMPLTSAPQPRSSPCVWQSVASCWLSVHGPSLAFIILEGLGLRNRSIPTLQAQIS